MKTSYGANVDFHQANLELVFVKVVIYNGMAYHKSQKTAKAQY